MKSNDLQIVITQHDDNTNKPYTFGSYSLNIYTSQYAFPGDIDLYQLSDYDPIKIYNYQMKRTELSGSWDNTNSGGDLNYPSYSKNPVHLVSFRQGPMRMELVPETKGAAYNLCIMKTQLASVTDSISKSTVFSQEPFASTNADKWSCSGLQIKWRYLDSAVYAICPSTMKPGFFGGYKIIIESSNDIMNQRLI